MISGSDFWGLGGCRVFCRIKFSCCLGVFISFFDIGILDFVLLFVNIVEDVDRMVCVRSGGKGFCC